MDVTLTRGSSPRSALTASILALATTACAGDAPASTFTVRDSAGVEIVESTACSWGSGGPLSVEEDPYLAIGEAGSNVPYRFIAITDALTLPDGRIAVAEQGSGQVRVFDTEGTHLLSFGRGGDGDGEFLSITRLFWWEDRLWVLDSKRALLSSFGGLGNLERLESLPPTGPDGTVLEDVLALDDGTLLAFHGGELPPPDGDSGSVSASAQTDSAGIATLDPSGLGPVISFPGSWSVDLRDETGAALDGSPPNTKLPSWSTDGTRVYYTSGDRGVFVADPTGRVLRVLRRPEPAPRPDAMPVYDGLVVDPDRNVWTLRLVGEGAGGWDVYGANGACRGTVRMPADLTVLEIGEDYVLGRTQARADVERVQLHRLRGR